MTTGVITPSQFTDGSYKRSSPKVVYTVILDLSPDEARSVRSGRRGCSCEAADLTALGERCMAVARDCRALSWSIAPVIGSLVGRPKVYVKFHNWPEMGMCNFTTPIGKPRYWWDDRPMPHWMAPDDEQAEKDEDGHFDLDA